jgi:hypothetical protein
MFRSTHRAHVCITLLYATGLSTSMYFVDPLLNEPLLLHHQIQTKIPPVNLHAKNIFLLEPYKFKYTYLYFYM